MLPRSLRAWPSLPVVRRSSVTGTLIHHALGQLFGRHQRLVVRPCPCGRNYARLCASRGISVLHWANISGWYCIPCSCPPLATVRSPLFVPSPPPPVVNLPGYVDLDVRHFPAWLWKCLWYLSRAGTGMGIDSNIFSVRIRRRHYLALQAACRLDTSAGHCLLVISRRLRHPIRHLDYQRRTVTRHRCRENPAFGGIHLLFHNVNHGRLWCDSVYS